MSIVIPQEVFKNLKQGHTFEVDGKKGEVFVSKGRKLIQFRSFIDSKTVTQKIRGYEREAVKYHYMYELVFDFERSVLVEGWNTSPNGPSYLKKDGAITSNKWDIYEENRPIN